jgi:hypothetical protein
MSRTLKIVSACFLALVVIAGIFAYRLFGPPPPGTDLSRSRATAKGLYIVTIAPEKEPFVRDILHSWIVTITDKAKNSVNDAVIAVDGRMPAHGHGLPTSPQMTANLGNGRYRIEGVRFHMFGWWEFSFDIKSKAGPDSIVFNLYL